MRISDLSSDVCSSYLRGALLGAIAVLGLGGEEHRQVQRAGAGLADDGALVVLENRDRQGVAVDNRIVATREVVVAAEGDGGRAGHPADMDVEAGRGGLRPAGCLSFRLHTVGVPGPIPREVISVLH